MKDFTCKRCGDCCKWSGYVYITEEDIARISKYLSSNKFDFVNRYANMDEKPRLNLKTKPNGECIFLKGNECSIYPVYPKQCADFPLLWQVKDVEKYCRGQRFKDIERPE